MRASITLSLTHCHPLEVHVLSAERVIFLHRVGFVEVRGVREREDCGGEHFRFYFLPAETLAGA